MDGWDKNVEIVACIVWSFGIVLSGHAILSGVGLTE
jgi:hypothetical protein